MTVTNKCLEYSFGEISRRSGIMLGILTYRAQMF